MKKEKMNDKGFSLVELIIVIAIMAVLVVVLAPQYLKYVERSRNSTDLQNATTIVTACQVWAADPEVQDSEMFKAGSFSIKVTSSGASVTAADPATNEAAVKAAVKDASLELDSTKCKSKTKWTDYTINGTIDANGGITFTYESNPAGAFADAMVGNTTTTTP